MRVSNYVADADAAAATVEAGVEYGAAWSAVGIRYSRQHGDAAGAADAADVGGEDVEEEEGVAGDPRSFCVRVSRVEAAKNGEGRRGAHTSQGHQGYTHPGHFGD